MNKHKLPLRLFCSLLAAVIFLPLAVADPPVDEASKPPPATKPAPQTAVDENQPQKPAKQRPASQRPSQQMPTDKQAGFTPTEKIGADSSVSFPVDI